VQQRAIQCLSALGAALDAVAFDHGSARRVDWDWAAQCGDDKDEEEESLIESWTPRFHKR